MKFNFVANHNDGFKKEFVRQEKKSKHVIIIKILLIAHIGYIIFYFLFFLNVTELLKTKSKVSSCFSKASFIS